MIFTQGRQRSIMSNNSSRVAARNRWISVIGCLLVSLFLGMAVPNGNVAAYAQHRTTKPTMKTATQIRQALKQQIHVTHARKAATPPTHNTVTPLNVTPLPAYNNVGTSDDSNPMSGSLDGTNSYSAQALQGVGFVPGQNVTYNNVTFVWPNVAAGLPNNYQASGQVIPVTPAISGAVKLGFLGASTNGTTSGTATVTYTDNSTSTFTLGLTDWAAAATTGNSLVASMTYRNQPTSQQTLTVSVFYTDVAIPAGKIVQSVTLPTTAGPGQLHIFAVGVSGPSYNNTGISADTSPSGANLDGGGYSYSATALTSAGVNAGATIPVDGISYPWPTANVATPDNYQATGQVLPVVPVANATELGFLGAAAGGDSSGTVTITFTDGSTQTSTLGLSDWTLKGGAETAPAFGNLIVSTMTYRNTSTTQQTMNAYLFAAEIALPAGKTAQSVTLPTTTAPGLLHIFAVGTRSILNNSAVSDDDNPSAAHFGGNGSTGYSYSAQALQGQNMLPGQDVVNDGIVYTWPSAPVGAADNYLATGQTISVAPVANATTLGFLGSATGGASSGTATITYTDASTQTITLVLSDWTLNGGAQTISAGNKIVATMAYRNSHTTQQTLTNYLFSTEFSLTTTKTIQSVTLPTTSSPGQLHIFAISTRSAYNNAGISDNANPLSANFDGAGFSYSAEDFTDPNTGMGWNPGDTLTYNGMDFLWPNVSSGLADNYATTGQVLAITPVASANTIGFVGASSGAATSITATLTYTDNSTSTFILGMSDWTLNGDQLAPSFNNRLFALLPHRNAARGQQNVDTYLFYAETTINTTKVLKSVTLPAAASNVLHIFSIGTRAGAGYLNNIGTSDDATTTFANYDGQGNSYSLEALQASKNITQGQSFLVNGVTFLWPTSYSVIPDNYQSAGTGTSFAPVISVTPVANATTLAFVGSATNGNSSGTATITYTDNTTSTFSLGFMDWTVGTATNGNHLVATMPYHNSATGQQNTPVYLYEAETSLLAGKTIQSVTLPSTTGNLHVFAVGTK